MVGAIEALGTTAPPVVPAPVKDPSAPAGRSDLRETQAAVSATQHADQHSDNAPKSDAEKELENAINDRLARLLGSDTRLSVEIDKGTGDFVYKSIDKKTGEVSRQWPAQTVLDTLAFFRELDGLIFDKKA